MHLNLSQRKRFRGELGVRELGSVRVDGNGKHSDAQIIVVLRSGSGSGVWSVARDFGTRHIRLCLKPSLTAPPSRLLWLRS